jgi:hypothetical protein
MRLRLLLCAAFTLAVIQSATAQYASGENAIAAAVPPRKVMTWVAPYAISPSLARLKALYSGVGPRNSLTHLALQFWVPTQAGGIARSARATITDQTIRTFVNWGHAYGIKVVLCVYNGDVAWDWPLAKQGFKVHREKFIAALIAEMQAQKLDGIDLDLEGPAGNFDADKPAYVAFVKELANRVHALHKTLTVDSFPWKWNAPNWNWWAALFPSVDAINSMGYDDLGRNPVPDEGWRRYSTQKSKAGVNYSAKLNIGIPSYKDSWQGDITLDQVKWFRTTAAGRVGIAIWDAQFPDASWKSAPVWANLRAIRQQR